MGLDVVAYAGLTTTSIVGYTQGQVEFYDNPSFPGRIEDIEPGVSYWFQAEYGFSAGPYSSYNRWRNELARFAKYPPVVDVNGEERFDLGAWSHATDGPFLELINFSDCEGTIGPKTCSKLAWDFQNANKDVLARMPSDFARLYTQWRRVFDMGSKGAVKFC